MDHTATLLSDGRVLVAGGYFEEQRDTAEIYDPLTDTWSPTGRLNQGRAWHTATLLSNGMVLVAGGSVDGTPFTSVELYDPAAGKWSPMASLNYGRECHTAFLLQDGRVLVLGEYTSEAKFKGELFNWRRPDFIGIFILLLLN
jgi:N-acetylneuraminic acid mutarotase